MDCRPLPDPELSVTGSGDGSTDMLIAGVRRDETLAESLQRLDESGDGWITRFLEFQHPQNGETITLASPSADGPRMVVLIGLPEADRKSAYETAAIGVRRLTDRSHSTINIALPESFDPSQHDAIVAGALTGCMGTDLYKDEPSIHCPESISFSGIDQASLDRGRIVGNAINHTRQLVNEPASAIYPASFADRAERMASESGLDIEVWDEYRLSQEGCRAILAVGQGSEKPPRLVMLRHNAGPKGQAPIVLVGKGVTFDSGGLSLKSSEGMQTMKCDMAGAATVFGVMQAVAGLGLNRNIIGICGLAENMVSGASYKLGDVIETRSGKTIEILNTDAEGRVVLADALDVAVQHRPRVILDLATLTGACMVALGRDVAGLMTNDQAAVDEVTNAAEQEGELVWQLPMFDLYGDSIKSKVADIKNVGDARWGGAITAAKFLENFVDGQPWVHIDIAGPAFKDSPKPHRDAGATGALVRTLIRWLENADS